MGCSNDNLLTEKQVDILQRFIHNYHHKEMGICSCDVERVLALNKTNYQSVRIQNDPLLVIKVKDMNSVPSVIYKGDDIKGKVSINYEWETKGFEEMGEKGKHKMKIKHIDCHKKYIVGKTIQEERLQ